LIDRESVYCFTAAVYHAVYNTLMNTQTLAEQFEKVIEADTEGTYANIVKLASVEGTLSLAVFLPQVGIHVNVGKHIVVLQWGGNMVRLTNVGAESYTIQQLMVNPLDVAVGLFV